MTLFHSFHGQQYSAVYMHHIFPVHSSANAHLGCFRVLTTMNSAVVNIGVHGSFQMIVSSGQMLWSGSAWSCDSSVQFFKEHPYCSPQWLYQFTVPQMELGGFFCTLTGAPLSTSSAHASPVPCCVGHGGRWEHLHHGNCKVLTDEGLSQASWLLNIPHCVTDCLLCVKHERVPGTQRPPHAQRRPSSPFPQGSEARKEPRPGHLSLQLMGQFLNLRTQEGMAKGQDDLVPEEKQDSLLSATRHCFCSKATIVQEAALCSCFNWPLSLPTTVQLCDFEQVT